jgi:hypothetical protein
VQPATAAPPAPASEPAARIDPTTDRAEGEDGCSYLAGHPDHTDDGQRLDRWGNDDYDDGYGPYDSGSGQDRGWSDALDASFPQGFPEPVPLGEHPPEIQWSMASAPSPELSGVATAHPYHALDDQPVGPPATTSAEPAAGPAHRPLQLSIEQKRSVIELIAGAESGSDRYAAVNADGEFRGRFGPDHPAYHHHHIGLSYGIVQFTQESGNLGRLLVMMRDRDEPTFRKVFGDHADELVTVTTAAGPSASQSPDGRSARTEPVDGRDLWEEPWLTRFRQAGNVTAFQAAQNELAASTFLDPMVVFCGDFGLDTDRALAITVDRAVQMGVGGAQQWIAAAAGPISTPALRHQGLSALGYADLASFQRAWGLASDGVWGPLSHAGMVGALRQLGGRSPVPLPTVDQMLDAIVRRAEADQVVWLGRVRRLRTAKGFSDQPYAR